MMDLFGKKIKAELNRLIGKKVRVYFKNTEMEGELFFSEVYTGFYFLEFENGGGIHFGWRKVKKVDKICSRK